MSVTALGRLYVTGNNSTHTVKLVQVSDGSDVPGGSVTLSFPSGTVGQFAYAALASPITLPANTAYYLMSQETSGGDQYLDLGPVTTTSAGVANGPVYLWPGFGYYLVGITNGSYVPVNLLYSGPSTSVPPTVAITAPAAGATVSGSSVAISATATPGTGQTVASVQFKVDGNNQGAADTTSPYGITLDSTKLSNGQHTITAVVTDSANNTANATPVTITVNNGVTTVAITAPSAGASVSGSAVTVSATATAAPGLTIANVQFKVDGNNQGAPATTSPYGIVLDTTKLTNGTHSLIAVAMDSSNTTIASSPITITVNNAAPSGTAFITGFTPGVGRNDFSGFVGMKFTVGSTPLKVSALGRIYLTGNSGSHVLKLVNASDGSDVAGGSVTLTTSGGTSGQFSYAKLPNPVTLSANTSYYLASQESSGGDQWYDATPVTVSAAGTVNGPVYDWPGYGFYLVNSGSLSYVPVNFQYTPWGAKSSRHRQRLIEKR